MESSLVPTPEVAEQLFLKGVAINYGPWVNHSRFAAHVARLIARAHPAMDEETGYVLGLLHDIGRIERHSGMAHITVGYRWLLERGYPLSAQIAMTHTFPIADVELASSGWERHEKDKEFTRRYLSAVSYTPYDRLIQLADSIGGIFGIVPMEVRLIDIALRHGTNDMTVAKWKALFSIKDTFEREIGRGLYDILGISGDTPWIPEELKDLISE